MPEFVTPEPGASRVRSSPLPKCPACDGPHAEVHWRPVGRPFSMEFHRKDGVVVYAPALWWAICPTADQPIFYTDRLRIADDDAGRTFVVAVVAGDHDAPPPPA